MIKTTRLFFAALALSIIAACTTDITAPDMGPSLDAEQTAPQRGMIGSGMG